MAPLGCCFNGLAQADAGKPIARQAGRGVCDIGVTPFWLMAGFGQVLGVANLSNFDEGILVILQSFRVLGVGDFGVVEGSQNIFSFNTAARPLPALYVAARPSPQDVYRIHCERVRAFWIHIPPHRRAYSKRAAACSERAVVATRTLGRVYNKYGYLRISAI